MHMEIQNWIAPKSSPNSISRGMREWKLEDRKHFLSPKGPPAALTYKPAATSWSLPVHPAGPAEGLLFIWEWGVPWTVTLEVREEQWLKNVGPFQKVACKWMQTNMQINQPRLGSFGWEAETSSASKLASHPFCPSPWDSLSSLVCCSEHSSVPEPQDCGL